MDINHIGYAVKNIERARKSFEELGYIFEPAINDYDRNVVLVFGSNDGYRIELVSPLDKTKESPVDLYLSKIGSVPYHICYQTFSLNATIEELKQKGFRIVTEPKPAIAFGGKRVVFMANLGMGLMEILEK